MIELVIIALNIQSWLRLDSGFHRLSHNNFVIITEQFTQSIKQEFLFCTREMDKSSKGFIVVVKIVRKISFKRFLLQYRKFSPGLSIFSGENGNESMIKMSAERIDDPTRCRARIFHTQFYEVWTWDKVLRKAICHKYYFRW